MSLLQQPVRWFSGLFGVDAYSERIVCRVRIRPGKSGDSGIGNGTDRVSFQKGWLTRTHCHCCQYLHKLTCPNLLIQGPVRKREKRTYPAFRRTLWSKVQTNLSRVKRNHQ